MTWGTSVQAEFIVQGKPRELPLEWDENLLRIGQEVLTNVLRHCTGQRVQRADYLRKGGDSLGFARQRQRF